MGSINSSKSKISINETDLAGVNISTVNPDKNRNNYDQKRSQTSYNNPGESKEGLQN